MADQPLRLLDHLEELRVRIIRVLLFTAPIFLFVITFEVHVVWWSGLPIPVGLGFTPFSALASQVFRFMVNQLVPGYVEPTQITAAQALTVQFEVAAFLTLILGMPVMAYEAWMFLAPALYQHERRLIARVVVPATALFIAGAIFAYLVILPFTFSWLYSVGAGLGARRFILNLDDFLDIVLVVMAAMGFAFQTPLIMWGLTSIGIVKPEQWRRWWRYAVVAFFAFGAVVTPDGSGVTMTLVALPMTALYVAGMGLSHALPRWGRRLLRRRPGRVVAASLAAIVAVAGAGYLYLDARLPGVERVAATDLGGGSAVLELPLITLYSLPPGPGLSSSTTAVLSENSSVAYSWGNATAANARVVFLLGKGSDPSLAPGPPGTFRIFPGRLRSPGGPVTVGVRDGHAGVLTITYTMEYSATSKQLLRGGSVVDRWIEVAYRLVGPRLRLKELPAANVSLPAPDELAPAGAWSVGFLGGTEFRVGLGDVPGLGRTFGASLPGPSLALTPGGVPTLLRSTFRWGAGDGYEVGVEGPADLSGTIALSWDLRFGSLYPRLA